MRKKGQRDYENRRRGRGKKNITMTRTESNGEAK